jgi:ribosomal protein S18 acetylase RimI-like enzyme
MFSVLHLRKELVRPPVALSTSGVVLRTFQPAEDIPNWLKLRQTAMADQVPCVRSWCEADFRTEMIAKSWWQSDLTWLAIASGPRPAREPSTTMADEAPSIPTIAEACPSPAIQFPKASGSVIGAATLAMREGPTRSVPVVHWLLVDPNWRRRGVGRMLISRLELSAWDAGWREVQLETHAGWQAAVAFYQSMGYASLRERSPR